MIIHSKAAGEDTQTSSAFESPLKSGAGGCKTLILDREVRIPS